MKILREHEHFGRGMLALAALSLTISCAGLRGGMTESERAAMETLDLYMETFNARDEVAWAGTLHYPHVRIAGGDVRVWQTAQDYVDYMDFDRFAASTGWDHSAWDARTVVQTQTDKVHVAVTFSRYNAMGEKFATYDSMYILTLREGHWGVQARSSFAP